MVELLNGDTVLKFCADYRSQRIFAKHATRSGGQEADYTLPTPGIIKECLDSRTPLRFGEKVFIVRLRAELGNPVLRIDENQIAYLVYFGILCS